MQQLNEQSITELVLRCQEEKPFGTKAFSSLVDTFQPAIYRFCLNYIKVASEAEELTQHVFLKVFHNISKFKHESSFKTWIYRIAVNICTDFYNKKKKQDQIQQEIKQARQTQPDASHDHEKVEDQDEIRKHLDKLSTQEREVLILRFYEDLKIQEIADTLGIQLSAAKMRLSRALEHFKVVYNK